MPFSAPLKVEVKPQVEVVDLGRNLELECVVTGFPIKSMWWLKNGHPVVESQRVIFESKEKLRIESVSLEDKGMYQCFVQNDKETVHGSSQVRLGGLYSYY